MSTTSTEKPADVTPPADPIADAAPEQDAGPVKSRRARKPRAPRKRTSAPATDSKPRTRSTTSRRPPIGKRMAELYATVGLGCSMAPNPTAQAVGRELVLQAKSCGEAWEALAKEQPQVAEVLDRLLTASAYGTLLAAHLPILLAGMVAAGKVPPGLSALVAPTVIPDGAGFDGQNTGGRP